MDHPPGAERLAAALTRSGEYRMLPCFGWMILIVRDHKNERHDEEKELIRPISSR